MRGMSRSLAVKILFALVALGVLSTLAYRIPAINSRLYWRLDAARVYARRLLDPVEAVPTPLAASTAVTAAPSRTPTLTATPTRTPSPTPGATATPTPSPTPLPASVSLPAPEWERQDWNNCGPATLSMYLRFFGWQGDQYDISDLLKPERGDKNVNIEELVYYVRTRAGWLNADFRVGGDIELLKRFLAYGLPVVIEEGYYAEESYYPNDDRWLGHYLLLTAYDDATQTFTVQDTFLGPNRQLTYEKLDEGWKTFNRVYLFLYRPEQEAMIKEILGPQWDIDYNRQYALELAQSEIDANPQDAFAWFNLGSNLVYFERWGEAARAYDEARRIGLPQRMFRYQFGPFMAYFHSGRIDELMVLTEYALRITDNSEEALLWQGWGLYRQGDTAGALERFRAALEANRFYQDAQYAIEFVGGN